jgi:hypothetical protein
MEEITDISMEDAEELVNWYMRVDEDFDKQQQDEAAKHYNTIWENIFQENQTKIR